MLHCRSVAGAWRTFALCSNTPSFEEVSTNFTSRENTGNASEVLPSADNLPRVSISGVGCGRILNRLITFICYTTATNPKTKRTLSIGQQWEPLTWRIQQCQLLDMYPILAHRPTKWQWTTPDTLFGASHVCDLVHTVDRSKKYSGVCYNERVYNEPFLSIKSGCYNVHICYNESGGILLADVARACAWRVGPYRFDQSVSHHHLCYRL